MRNLLIVSLALSLLVALPAFAGWEEGVAAFKSGNFQGAAKEFEAMVKQNPEWRGHYMLGLSLEQLKRKEEALHHLRQAYDLNPNELSVKLALGRAYSNLRRHGDVVKLLGSFDAGSLPAEQQIVFYQMRGAARAKQDDMQGAMNDFKKLASLKPNDFQAQYMYASTALKADQLDTGIAALDKASKLAPNNADVQRTYITVLIKKGRETRDKAAKKSVYGKAADLAGALVQKEPTYDNLMLKVSAELGAGRYSNAVATGKAAVAKNSGDWLAHYYLGQAYTSNKQYDDSVAPLEKAKALCKRPQDLNMVWKQLGYAYEKQKKYAQAIDAYEKAGDQGGVARVKENQETEQFNKKVEEENKAIRQMEEEAKKLEEELKALEGGGGMR